MTSIQEAIVGFSCEEEGVDPNWLVFGEDALGATIYQ